MSYIVEFEVVSPYLEKAIKAVPDIVIETEELLISADGSIKHLCWVTSGELDQFETALGDDPTIQDSTVLAAIDDRRLYRVTFREEDQKALTYPVATNLDISFLDATTTRKGSQIRARFPSRESLFAFRDACDERDIPFRLHSIYREEGTSGGSAESRLSVTELQTEALVLAMEEGYFSIPRETTLSEIAAELDISTQALSTRLRRGHTNLIQDILVS